MNIKSVLSMFVSLCLLGSISIVSAQDSAQTGSIEGTVEIVNRERLDKGENVRLCPTRSTWSNDTKIHFLRKSNKFRYDNLEPGLYYIATPDWEGTPVEVKAGETTKVEIVSGRNVFQTTGTVIFDDKPLEGGKIIFTPVEPARDRVFWPPPTQETVIEEDGTFRVQLTEEGLYHIHVRPKRPSGWDFVPVDAVIPPASFEVWETIEPGKILDLKTPENEVQGRIDMNGFNAGFEGYSAILYSRHFPAFDTLKRSTYFGDVKDNFISYKHVPEGPYDFFLVHSGLTDPDNPIGTQIKPMIRVGKGMNRFILELQPTYQVDFSSTIKRSQVPLIFVLLQNKEHPRHSITTLALRNHTEEDSSPATTKLFAPEGDYSVFAYSYRTNQSVQALDLTIDQPVKVKIDMEIAGEVRVKLKSENADVGGRTVRIWRKNGKEVPRLREPMLLTRRTLISILVMPTDREGNTIIRGLPPEEYDLTVDGFDVKVPVTVEPEKETKAIIEL